MVYFFIPTVLYFFIDIHKTPSTGATMTALIVPLTMFCLAQAAFHYRVDPVVLEAIRVVENGETGKIRRNTNGTSDLGPFQVNSSWIGPLRKKGVRVSFARLRDNGCLNAYVAAYILSEEVRRAPGESLRTAIGRYHSRRPKEARRLPPGSSGKSPGSSDAAILF